MGEYPVRSKWSQEEAIKQAIQFFGEEGLGLDLTEQGPGSVRFVGGDGYVFVTAEERERPIQGDKRTYTEVTTSGVSFSA